MSSGHWINWLILPRVRQKASRVVNEDVNSQIEVATRYERESSEMDAQVHPQSNALRRMVYLQALPIFAHQCHEPEGDRLHPRSADSCSRFLTDEAGISH
jgi:hypothetical protein